MTPRVINKHREPLAAKSLNATYVGRPTKWGNPYKVTKRRDRMTALELYEKHLHTSGLISQVHELAGRDLVCTCTPEPCHADILLRLANERSQP